MQVGRCIVPGWVQPRLPWIQAVRTCRGMRGTTGRLCQGIFAVPCGERCGLQGFHSMQALRALCRQGRRLRRRQRRGLPPFLGLHPSRGVRCRRLGLCAGLPKRLRAIGRLSPARTLSPCAGGFEPIFLRSWLEDGRPIDASQIPRLPRSFGHARSSQPTAWTGPSIQPVPAPLQRCQRRGLRSIGRLQGPGPMQREPTRFGHGRSTVRGIVRCSSRFEPLTAESLSGSEGKLAPWLSQPGQRLSPSCRPS
jgi:hypothetical protein